MKGYEIVEHTADVGIRAYGKNLSECFENAAKGMFAIITDNSRIDSVGEYRIRLKSESIEDLLVEWLSELLFLNSAYNLVFGEFEVDLNEKENSLDARVLGEEYNRDKHGYGTEIKAVTYHMLEVKKGRTCEIQVLFDI